MKMALTVVEDRVHHLANEDSVTSDNNRILFYGFFYETEYEIMR